MRSSRIAACTIAIVIGTATCLDAQELKAPDIIAKHLDAVGSKEKRDSVKTLIARGNSEFESTMPLIKGGGKAIIVSDPENLFFLMSLNSREYPYEKIGYFHGGISIPFINPGVRSLLGAFLADHEKVLSDGLFAGAMSLRWAAFDTKPKAKLTSDGVKTVDGKKVYVLNVNSSGGGSSEFVIRLYFDPASFNHVRSEYRYTVTPQDAVFGQQNRRAAGQLIVTEDFSDFRNVDGLTLPYVYRVTFETNGSTGPGKNIWTINVTDWFINQKLAPDFFTFDAK